MSIRTKTFSVVLLTLLALLSAVYVASDRLVTRGFLRVEDQLARADIRRAVQTIDNLGSNLSTKLSDWASWDDAYAFVREPNEHFIRSNISYAGMADLELSAMILLDVHGAVVFAAHADSASGSLGPLPAALQQLIDERHSVARHEDSSSSKSGIVVGANGPAYYIASRPITPTSRDGAIGGTMIWATALDEARIGRKSERIGLDIKLASIRQGVAPDQSAALDRLRTASDGVEIVVLDNSTIEGHTIIPDIDGHEAMLLSVREPRPVYARSQTTVRYFMYFLLIAGVVFAGAMMLAMHVITTRRLASLADEIRGIDADLSHRLTVGSSDELAAVASSFNRLLDQVTIYHASLRESERRFRQLSDATSLMIWMSDSGGRDTFHSRAFLDFTGASSEQLGHEIWPLITHPEDLPRVMSTLAAAAAQGQQSRMDFRVRRADGEYRLVESVAAPRLDVEGRSIGHVGYLRDVTEERLAARRVAESEAKFRAMFESAPVAIALCDADGTIIEFNEGFARLIHGEDASELGSNLRDILPAETRSQFFAALAADHGAQRVEPSESAILTALRECPVIISGVVATTPTGDRRCWIFAEDISERVASETRLHRYAADLVEAKTFLERQAEELERRAQELETARRAAEDAARAKSEFLANMSHEIRTPMTAILGYTELLSEPDLTPALRDSHIRTVRASGEHLLQIINDILDISKIEAGKMSCEKIRCSPEEIAQLVMQLFRGPARAKGIELSIDIARPIPGAIMSDPLRLRQILVNLVSNAVKFTQHGGVTLRVRSHVDDQGSAQLMFDVADTGIGIGQEHIARIFEPFSQADASMTRRFGGTGLGLAISRRLAEMLGGGISVVSHAGIGSTFTLTLGIGPASDVQWADIAEPAPRTESAGPAAQISLSGQVLVAEDGPDNRRLITHYLTKAGAGVTVVADGQSAIDTTLHAQAQGRPFDVVLMDMQMPVLDGYAATKRLRDGGYRGPIIALTAHAMAGDRQRCIDAGCDDYLPKPIDRAALIAACARWSAGGSDRAAA